MRKGIDPGLLEWVRGNTFRTRVWPIPAGGHRTVRIEYASHLPTRESAGNMAALYRVPLRLPNAVPELTLRVEIVKGERRPEIRGAEFGTVPFERWEERWVAQTTLHDVRPTEDLVVALPVVPERGVAVERVDEGDYYFVIDDFPPMSPRPTDAPEKPGRVALLWDASLSRSPGGEPREVAFLKSWLARLGDVAVDLIVFRDVAEPVRSFVVEGSDGQALLDHLGRLVHDGGTNLEVALATAREGLRRDVGYAILMSDGFGTLGSTAPRGLEVPLFTLSASSQADHALLRQLADSSGGAHLDLSAVGDGAALAVIGGDAFSFQGADLEGVTELYPLSRHPIGGRFTFCGRLTAPEATVTLHYGAGNVTSRSRRYTLLQGQETATDLVPRLWAQQKVARLQLDAARHREEILSLGRRFGIVTPGTSLLVLETLEQYLEHDVEPPVTRPAFRAEYGRRVQRREKQVKEVQQRKLDQVAAMWERRVEWWERNYEYDPREHTLPKREAPDDSLRALGYVAESVEGGVPGGVEGGVPGGVVGGVVGGLPAEEFTAAVETPVLAAPAGALRSASGGPGAPAKLRDAAAPDPGTPTVSVKPWDPDTPYLEALRDVSPADAYSAYLEQRLAHGDAPAFYLDCADHLLGRGRSAEGRRVLTAVLELGIEEPRLLRVVAHRLVQIDEPALAVPLFEQVLRLRPEEPQSLRDLALALSGRAEIAIQAEGRLREGPADDLLRAVSLLYDVVLQEWDDRFPEIELVALMDLNRLLAILERRGEEIKPGFIDPRLRRLLDADLRVVLTWDTNLSDMDLWVVEPSGEKCFYSNTLTAIGGTISRDFTGGYGPEEYLVRRAFPGRYAVKTNYFGSREPSIVGPTTIQVTVFTAFGRPEETRESITLRLTGAREVMDVGEAVFESAEIGR